jgi:hypothetical protein
MKKIVFVFMVIILFTISCEKDDTPFEKIIGEWQLVKGFDIMLGGFYNVGIEDQRIEEYTKNNQRIRFDYLRNEIGRCSFRINESIIIIYGEEINGEEWDSSYEYLFVNDTLKIRNDGGFEYYDEFFVRIK